MKPLITTVLDLDAALGGNADLLLGGGLGLYLKQEHLRAAGAKTLLPFERMPPARTTHDIDLFLRAEVIASKEHVSRYRQALDSLHFTVVAEAKWLKFRRRLGDAEVLLDVMVGPLGEHAGAVRIKQSRVRPKDLGGARGLHAFATEEALGIEHSSMPLTVAGTRGDGSAGACVVLIPRAFPYALMKLGALRDRIHDENKMEGRHHAMDLYRIVSMLTEEDEAACVELARAFATDAVIAEAKRTIDTLLARGVLAKLDGIPFAKLERDDRLALLRAWSLCLIRLGPATPTEVAAILAHLDPCYPAKDDATNTELVRLLTYLDSPTVVGKTVALMRTTQTQALAYDKAMLSRHEYGKPILESMANTPNSQNIHYAYCLRRVQRGWSLAHRKDYFTWLNDTLAKSGGKSFVGYIRAIREDAIDHLPPQDAAAVASLLAAIAPLDLSALPVPQGPAVAWTTETAMPLFEKELRARDFENGEQMFSAGKCVVCHRFQGSGGLSGPDLGSLAKRFSVRDILVSICEPSHTIAEQYQASVVTLTDGSAIVGRVIYRDDTEIAVASNPYDLSVLVKTPIAKIEKIEPSPISMMPLGTIMPMNEEELSDLMAYLLSGGDRRHKMFQAK